MPKNNTVHPSWVSKKAKIEPFVDAQKQHGTLLVGVQKEKIKITPKHKIAKIVIIIR